MLDAGADVLETDTFQASRLKLGEWGLEAHTHEINLKAAQIARKAAGEQALRGRLDRPDRVPARQRRPDPGPDQLPRAGRRVHRAGHGSARGRRRSDHHRDRAGHPRGQGRHVRRPPGQRGGEPPRADPVQRLATAPGRQDAARHRHQRRARHPRRARRRRDRAELLHRPRGHARCDPLPRRVQPRPRPLHPQRRPPAPGAQRRDDLPRGARATGHRAGRVRRPLRRLDRRRLLRDHARSHPRHRRARQGLDPRAAAALAVPSTPAR